MAEKITLTFEGNGNAEKVVKSLNKSLKDMGDTADNSSKKASTAFSVFQGTLASGIALKALDQISNAASKLFNTFVTDGIKAAQVQEDAINKLNTALIQTGDYSEAASQDLQNFASQLQKTSTFGDEVIISQLALAKSFGATNDQAKQLVQAAADLAQQTGITLDSAVRNLGKTFGGLTGELGEVVPELKNLTKEQLQSGAAIDLIASKFSGSAASALQTYSGSVASLSNQFGDFTETVGELITKNPAIIATFNEISKIINNLDLSLSQNSKTFSTFINEAVVSTIQGIGTMLEVFARLGQVIDLVLLPFNAALQVIISGMFALSEVASGDFQAAKEIMAAGFSEIGEEIDKTFNIEDSALYQAGQNVSQLAENVKAASQSAAGDLKVAQLDIKKTNKEIEKAQKDTSLNIKSFEESNNKERVANLQSTFGAISGLTKSTNKQLFDIGKAAAVANATIDGILAVQKALASAPPPFNFVLAALVGTATAVNIANIASQQPPQFADGATFVEGTGGTDRIPAFVNRGERILTTEQNKDLTAFLNKEGNTQAILAGILEAVKMNGGGVSVSIGGKTLVNTLNEEIEAGNVLNVAV